jgi:sigma-E factor negative regulatory protein RseC
LRELAVVKKIMPGGRAVVTIARDAQCGAGCPGCRGCGSSLSPPAETEAVNAAGAGPGDRVILESSTSQMLVLPLAVFLGAVLMPVVLFHLGKWLNGTPAVSWAMAALGTGISVWALWLYHGKVTAAPPVARVVCVESNGNSFNGGSHS